jgi:superfamily II DNA or RNA helicase
MNNAFIPMSLLSYQESHVASLEKALNDPCHVAIDASDTGTGKTYTAAGLAKKMGLRVVVICPKAVLIIWQRVLNQFGVEILGIANYELFKGGRWYTDVLTDTKERCNYTNRTADKSIEWKDLKGDMLFIFDEVHRCKNKATGNAKILLSLADQPCKKLLLSATIADKPQYFAVFAKMLDFIDDVNEFRLFLKRLHVGTAKDSKSYLQRMKKIQPDMRQLHKMVFPAHGARMKIADLSDHFPNNKVIADTYKMDDDVVQEIKKQYEYISAVHTEAEAKESMASCPLTIIIRARQKIEALKVRTMTELVKDHLNNGNSVAVFVNYLDTMALLQHMLGVDCVIKGGQSTAERQSMIDAFNEDRERVIVCQIQSGGVGISLHDTIGVHPRVSIISPSWSAQDLMQAFGRIHRAAGKTPCIQKLVYCHDTIEEKICDIINTKLVNYALLNDGKI